MNDDVWPLQLLRDADSLPPRVLVFTPVLFDMPELSQAYAERCLLDSIERGESPLVPELLWGMAGDLGECVELSAPWVLVCERVCLYIDHPAYDETRARAQAAARALGVELEERSIHGAVEEG